MCSPVAQRSVSPKQKYPYPPNTYSYPSNTYSYPRNTYPYPPNTYSYPRNWLQNAAPKVPSEIACDQLVVAAGSWSKPLAAKVKGPRDAPALVAPALALSSLAPAPAPPPPPALTPHSPRLGPRAGLPDLRRDWAHPCHICAGTGLTATPAVPRCGRVRATRKPASCCGADRRSRPPGRGT